MCKALGFTKAPDSESRQIGVCVRLCLPGLVMGEGQQGKGTDTGLAAPPGHLGWGSFCKVREPETQASP